MISESDSSRHLEQTNCAAGVSAAAMKYDFIIVVVMVSRVVLQTIHRIHNRFSQSRRRAFSWLKVPFSPFTFKTL